MGLGLAVQLKQKEDVNNQNKMSRLWQQLTNEKVLAGPVSNARHNSASRLKQLATHLVHFLPGQYCVV